MNKKIKLEYLYNKYIDNTITADELHEFVSLAQEARHADFLSLLVQESFENNTVEPRNVESHQAFLRFQSAVGDEMTTTTTVPVIQNKKSLSRRLWKYTAAAAVLIFSLLYFAVYQYSDSSETVRYTKLEDVQPGRNTAFIQTIDGQQVALSGVGVLRVEQDQLVDGKQQLLSKQHDNWQTLVVPKGGQYQIVLADGTKVWLNADTKLSFPTQFVGQSRRVKLQGEAYFEVTHNPDMPFVVESEEQQVNVLGTKFNVSTYTDEDVTTTLLSGKVNVTAYGQHSTLSPGQQSIVRSNDLHVQVADIEATMAWKNERFVFNKKPLAEFIKELERWYNVDIEIHTSAKKLRSKTFTGSISRNVKFTDIMTLFNETQSIRFEMIEGRVYLMN